MTAHLPTVDPESEPFWEATLRSLLLIKRCLDCGGAHFYPRPFCPACWSQQVEWEEASGEATVYAFSVVRRNELPPFDRRVPYVAAVVRLREGPLMVTNVEDCDVDSVTIDMPVVVAFRSDGDFALPVFRPAL